MAQLLALGVSSFTNIEYFLPRQSWVTLLVCNKYV